MPLSQCAAVQLSVQGLMLYMVSNPRHCICISGLALWVEPAVRSFPGLRWQQPASRRAGAERKTGRAFRREASFRPPASQVTYTPAYYTLSGPMCMFYTGFVSPPFSPHGRRCWRGRWRPTAPPSKRAAATPAAWCCASGTRRRRPGRRGLRVVRWLGAGLLHLGVGV